MDNYQKVEQLVSKAGCSYEDAKAALEGCDWDMLDAVISLEREGKVKKEQAEPAAAKEEETVEIIHEVVPEVIVEDEKAESKKSAESSKKAKGSAKREHKLWNSIKRFMTKNRLVIIKSNGQQMADLPIVVPIIAFLAFFWAVLIIALIAMAFGCRFHFEGEDLGKTNINNTMDKATDYAEKVKDDLAGKVNGRQNTDN